MRAILPLLLWLIVAMGQEGKVGLGQITGLYITHGTYEYLDKYNDVKVEADGIDKSGDTWKIKARFKGGYPVEIWITEPKRGL